MCRYDAICIKCFASNDITIGVIQYDLTNVEKSFKDLRTQGFGSCEINYNTKFTPELARQIKEASKKHQIKVTTVVGVPGSKSVWNFRQGPATIGLVPTEERAEKIKVYHEMIDFCAMADIPAMHSHLDLFRKIRLLLSIKISSKSCRIWLIMRKNGMS